MLLYILSVNTEFSIFRLLFVNKKLMFYKKNYTFFINPLVGMILSSFLSFILQFSSCSLLVRLAGMELICDDSSSSWIFLFARRHANSSWNEGRKIRWQNCDATLYVFLLAHQFADATFHNCGKQSIFHFIRLAARFR